MRWDLFFRILLDSGVAADYDAANAHERRQRCVGVCSGEELPDPMLELTEEAVLVGGRRAMDTISRLPLVDAEVYGAVEQMRWLLVRMVAVQARTLRGAARRRAVQPEEDESRLPYEVERDQQDKAR